MTALAPRDLELTVEVVTEIGRLQALADDYRQLCTAARATLPFDLHDWHVAWAKNFLFASAALRDTLLLHVVRTPEQLCVGIVALVLTERPGTGPLRIGTLAQLGSDPFLTELRKPLIAPGYEGMVGKAVMKALAAEPRWDWAYWDGIEGELQQELERTSKLHWQKPMPDYVLDLAPSWELFKKGLKRNIRESLRHCYNSLKRDGHEYELEVVKSPDDMKAGIETFLKLHASRAELQCAVEHPNRFGTPRTRRFLLDVTSMLAARDIARVFLLKIDGQVVAARVGFEVGDSLYLYYSGFDPEWAKYSVTTTLVAEAIKYAIARGLKTVNLSAGTDVSKTRWGAREVNFSAAVQARPRARSRILYGLYRRSIQARAGMPLTRGPLMDLLSKVLPKRNWSSL